MGSATSRSHFGVVCLWGDSSALCSLLACAEGHGDGCGQRCACLNGGVCNPQGQCQCPPGWSGSSCESREWGRWDVGVWERGLLSAELNVWIAAAGRLGVLWSGWVPRFWGK